MGKMFVPGGHLKMHHLIIQVRFHLKTNLSSVSQSWPNLPMQLWVQFNPNEAIVSSQSHIQVTHLVLRSSEHS